MTSSITAHVGTRALVRGLLLEQWIQPIHYSCQYEHACSRAAISNALTHQLALTNQKCGRDKRHPLQRLSFIEELSKNWWWVNSIIDLPRRVKVEKFTDELLGSFVRPRHCARLEIRLEGLDQDELQNLLNAFCPSDADVANCRITSRSNGARAAKRRFRAVKYDELLIGDQILYRKRRSRPQ